MRLAKTLKKPCIRFMLEESFWANGLIAHTAAHWPDHAIERIDPREPDRAADGTPALLILDGAVGLLDALSAGLVRRPDRTEPDDDAVDSDNGATHALVVASGRDEIARALSLACEGLAVSVVRREMSPAAWVGALHLVLAGERYVCPDLNQALNADASADGASDRPPCAAPSRAAAGAEMGAALTPREHEVMERVARGLPNKLIAWELGLSQNTIKVHIHHTLAKLGASNRTQAVAILRGLDRPPGRPLGPPTSRPCAGRPLHPATMRA